MPDSLRIFALKAADPDPSVVGIMRDPSPAVRAAVARTLANREAVDPELLLFLAEDPIPDVATAALRGLARVFEAPPPRLQDVLIEALERGPYIVRLAAIDALAIAGTVGAVEPLQAVLRASFFDHRLRHSARSAVRSIQLRAGNGEAGQLSVLETEEHEGQLSESEVGAVSEAPTKRR